MKRNETWRHKETIRHVETWRQRQRRHRYKGDRGDTKRHKKT